MQAHSPASPVAAPPALLDDLKAIVGGRYLLTGDRRTERYRTGFRFGSGKALAVALPGSLLELWKVVNACARAGVIIIMQAANTGLTGGSTPDGDNYDRDIVIISTTRLHGIQLIRNGTQAICLPGSRLFELEDMVAAIGREPHSRIGSSCIGASILGGICNNSGGALIHRGPAYTEMALYARIMPGGEVELVNHLGVDLGDTPEAMLERLDAGGLDEATIADDPARACSDHTYQQHVRQVDADTPARFNNDPRHLHEAAGSGGHVVVFAVRLDTFPREDDTVDFYIGTNDPAELTALRRTILTSFANLPIQGEYIHRSAFRLTERYGKDTFLAIHYLGARHLPRLFALKGRFDAFFGRMRWAPRDLSDRLMQAAAALMPRHLPERMRDFDRRFEHHLMLRMGGHGIAEARDLLAKTFPSPNGAWFECTKDEGEKAFLHRFAVAGASIRYRALHRDLVDDFVALDVALRRDDQDWNEQLPEDIAKRIVGISTCGHFFCHVFHRDYFLKKGEDPVAFEQAMLRLLDARGAEYPAEHNVGHLYPAKQALKEHYRTLDPTNSLNPGIGLTSRRANWA
ncbi:D-lactate dehydrogenase [Novosphingobium sp. KACC 22771]|uniref:D-lactate dehydrogenase n=1 Tax=Novosphingobium sp. KACC 22771 TaxID=3025670 RepID=UPI0023658136|nr:D-lactate dehydrogenase [Novosphingobium sp. KACC 22771]WDF72561.1 D-lactate dehydrogenase [Novosphingobium sp. KACC 22771]